MTQTEFDRRLKKLVRAATADRLCPGCCVQSLMTAAGALVEACDTATLRAHGIGAAIVPITDDPTPDSHIH